MGLFDLRAREYDPGAGRFESQDSWKFDSNYPADLNQYKYAAIDPIGGADPSGHFFEFVSQILNTIARIPGLSFFGRVFA